MAAIKMKGVDPYDYCEQWFSSDVYQSTYNDIVHAISNIHQWRSEAICESYIHLHDNMLAGQKRI